MDTTRRRFLMGSAAVVCAAALPLPVLSQTFVGVDLAKPGSDFVAFMKVWHDGTTLHIDEIEWREVYIDPDAIVGA